MKLQRDPKAAPCLVPAIGRGLASDPIQPGEILEVPAQLAWCFGVDVPGSGWVTPPAEAPAPIPTPEPAPAAAEEH